MRKINSVKINESCKSHVSEMCKNHMKIDKSYKNK